MLADDLLALHDGGKVHVYSQHLLSSAGKQDGLYWPTGKAGRARLGPLIADARAAGYHPGENAEQQPYHGYYFHILKGQGPHGPGGAYGCVVNGRMLGGFGLVAWPAQSGNTGVMVASSSTRTGKSIRRISDQPRRTAQAMTRFDPDATWQKVGAPRRSQGRRTEGDDGN